MPEQTPLTAREVAKQDLETMQQSPDWGKHHNDVNSHGDRLGDIENFNAATDLELEILNNYIELPIWNNFELQKQNIITKIALVKEILLSTALRLKEKSDRIETLIDQCHDIIDSVDNSNLEGAAVDLDDEELQPTGTG